MIPAFSAVRFLERPPYGWETPDIVDARTNAALQLDGGGVGARATSVVRLHRQWPLRWAASMWELTDGASDMHVELRDVAFGVTRYGAIWRLRHLTKNSRRGCPYVH